MSFRKCRYYRFFVFFSATKLFIILLDQSTQVDYIGLISWCSGTGLAHWKRGMSMLPILLRKLTYALIFESKYNVHTRKCFQICCLQNSCHFVSASMLYTRNWHTDVNIITVVMYTSSWYIDKILCDFCSVTSFRSFKWMNLTLVI